MSEERQLPLELCEREFFAVLSSARDGYDFARFFLPLRVAVSPVLSALARFRWPIIAGNITEIGVCSGLLAIVKHQSNMDENRILAESSRSFIAFPSQVPRERFHMNFIGLFVFRPFFVDRLMPNVIYLS